jgi:ABC-2 type transport system permease protein
VSPGHRWTLDVLLSSALVQARLMRSPVFVVLGIVQPAAFLVVTILARRSPAVDLSQAGLGAGLLSIWAATVWQSGLILRAETWEGTLGPIVSRPAGLAVVLLGKSVGATVRAAVFIGATVAIVSALLRHPIEVDRPLPFAAALAAVLASATVVGMLLSSLFLVTRAANRIAEALMYPVFILGGLLVPLRLLPHWIRPLADLVSLRWGVDLMRAASSGAAQPGRAWLWLGVTTAVYAVLARVAFRRMLVRARSVGSLELY